LFDFHDRTFGDYDLHVLTRNQKGVHGRNYERKDERS
jgi:hypothetical protein